MTVVTTEYSPVVPTLHAFPHPGFTFSANNSFPPAEGGDQAAERLDLPCEGGEIHRRRR